MVALFRAGHDEAFRVIHDRYRARLFAYTRQMLRGSSQDAEDAIQDIFVRAYSGLRSDWRDVALRAWLYRIAHNRCIDELRRPAPPAPEMLEQICSPVQDPTVEAEHREALRRLLIDVQRLPEQQRSALLMRELGGVPYADLATALDVSVPALKSLLVRARVSLAQSLEARNTECSEIREELITAHDRGVRPSGLARRHMRDCPSCRTFRTELRGMSRQFAALIPALGPMAVVAKALGFGGVGGGAGSGAAAGSSAITAGGAVGTGGAAASVGVIGAGHVATLLAAAVVTAAGAVEIQQGIVQSSGHSAQHRVQATGSSNATANSPSAPASGSQNQSSTATGAGSGYSPQAAPVRVPPPPKSVAAPPAAPQVGSGTSSPPPPPTVTPPSTGGMTPTGISPSSNTTGPPSSSGTGTGTTTAPIGELPPTSNPTGLIDSTSGPPSSGTTSTPTGDPPPSSSGGTTTTTTPTGTSGDPGSSPPSLGSTSGGSGSGGSGGSGSS